MVSAWGDFSSPEGLWVSNEFPIFEYIFIGLNTCVIFGMPCFRPLIETDRFGHHQFMGLSYRSHFGTRRIMALSASF